MHLGSKDYVKVLKCILNVEMEMDETKKLIKMEQRTFLEKNLFENGWNLNEEIFNNIMKGLNERKSEMIFFLEMKKLKNV